MASSICIPCKRPFIQKYKQELQNYLGFTLTDNEVIPSLKKAIDLNIWKYFTDNNSFPSTEVLLSLFVDTLPVINVNNNSQLKALKFFNEQPRVFDSIEALKKSSEYSDLCKQFTTQTIHNLIKRTSEDKVVLYLPNITTSDPTLLATIQSQQNTSSDKCSASRRLVQFLTSEEVQTLNDDDYNYFLTQVADVKLNLTPNQNGTVNASLEVNSNDDRECYLLSENEKRSRKPSDKGYGIAQNMPNAITQLHNLFKQNISKVIQYESLAKECSSIRELQSLPKPTLGLVTPSTPTMLEQKIKSAKKLKQDLQEDQQNIINKPVNYDEIDFKNSAAVYDIQRDKEQQEAKNKIIHDAAIKKTKDYTTSIANLKSSYITSDSIKKTKSLTLQGVRYIASSFFKDFADSDIDDSGNLIGTTTSAVVSEINGKTILQTNYTSFKLGFTYRVARDLESNKVTIIIPEKNPNASDKYCTIEYNSDEAVSVDFLNDWKNYQLISQEEYDKIKEDIECLLNNSGLKAGDDLCNSEKQKEDKLETLKTVYNIQNVTNVDDIDWEKAYDSTKLSDIRSLSPISDIKPVLSDNSMSSDDSNSSQLNFNPEFFNSNIKIVEFTDNVLRVIYNDGDSEYEACLDLNDLNPLVLYYKRTSTGWTAVKATDLMLANLDAYNALSKMGFQDEAMFKLIKQYANNPRVIANTIGYKPNPTIIEEYNKMQEQKLQDKLNAQRPAQTQDNTPKIVDLDDLPICKQLLTLTYKVNLNNSINDSGDTGEKTIEEIVKTKFIDHIIHDELIGSDDLIHNAESIIELKQSLQNKTLNELLQIIKYSDLFESYGEDIFTRLFNDMVISNPDFLLELKKIGNHEIDNPNEHDLITSTMLKALSQTAKINMRTLPGQKPVRVTCIDIDASTESTFLGLAFSEACYDTSYDIPFTGTTPSEFSPEVLELLGLDPQTINSQSEEWTNNLRTLQDFQNYYNTLLAHKTETVIVDQDTYTAFKTLFDSAGIKPIITSREGVEFNFIATAIQSDMLEGKTAVMIGAAYNESDQQDLLNAINFALDNPLTTSLNAKNNAVLASYNNLLRTPCLYTDTKQCLSAQDIMELSQGFADTVSKILTEIQHACKRGTLNNVNYLQDVENKEALEGKSRKEIVDYIGVDRFMKIVTDRVVIQLIDPYDSAHWVISQNTDVFMYFANSVLLQREGFSFSVLSYSKNTKNSGQTTLFEDDDSDEYESRIEHWQIEAKTVDGLKTVSSETRRLFNFIEDVDDTNCSKKSPQGLFRYKKEKEVKNTLVNWLAGCRTLEDMITILERRATQHPWISQILIPLRQPSGDSEKLKAEFFSLMHNPKILYSTLTTSDGKCINKIKNENPLLDRKMSQLRALYKQNVIPLFNRETINKLLPTFNNAIDTLLSAYLPLVEDVDRDDSIEDKFAEIEQRWLSDEYQEARNTLYSTLTDIYTKYLNIDLKINLIQITSVEDIAEILKSLQTLQQTLNDLINHNQSILNSSLNASEEKDLFLDNILNYSFNDGTRNPYYMGATIRKLLSAITKFEANSIDAITYSESKTYQSNPMPSACTELASRLRNFAERQKAWKELVADDPFANKVWWSRNPSLNQDTTGLQLPPVFSIFYGNNFKHKMQLSADHQFYMKDMSGVSLIWNELNEYFASIQHLEEPGYHFGSDGEKHENNSTNGVCPLPMSWFKLPTMADKPSCEYIQLPVWVGTGGDSKTLNYRKKAMTQYFLQEIDRIKTVKARRNYFYKKLKDDIGEEAFNKLSEEEKRQRIKQLPDYLVNYDDNGDNFIFLDYVSHYEDFTKDNESIIIKGLNNEEKNFNELVHKMINDEEMESWEKQGLVDGFVEATTAFMEHKTQELITQLKHLGLWDKLIKERHITDMDEKDPVDIIRTFVWSHKINNIAMIQMFHGDKAFYKDSTEAQKRFAQAHSSMKRPFTDACSPTIEGHVGEKVSDGKHRCIVLKDIKRPSEMIPYMSAIYEKLIADAENSRDSALKAYYEAQYEKRKKEYQEVNATDGQAMNCPSSIRKKMVMLGKWTEENEMTYQKFRKWFYYKHIRNDETAAQKFQLTAEEIHDSFAIVIKPYMITNFDVESHNGGKSDSDIIRVKMQLKNSEFCAFPFGVMSDPNDSTANLLNPVLISMESSYYDAQGNYLADGIDSIQFQSCVKVGGKTPLDVQQFEDDKDNGESRCAEYLNDSINRSSTIKHAGDNQNEEAETILNSRYNNEFVMESSYMDWGEQVQVNNDFLDGQQAETSQSRIILCTDLRETELDGSETQYFLGKDEDGNDQYGNKEEFQKKFNDLHVQKIQLAMQKLAKTLGLNEKSEAQKNLKLSNAIIQEVVKNPDRYGAEILEALQVSMWGEFSIPLSDPETRDKVEALLNSMLKNKVYKDPIPGAPVVQVSCFGKHEALNVRFKSKNGQLYTKKEFEKQFPDKDFMEYVKENELAVDCIEAYATMPSSELENFMDSEGRINIDAVEKVNPDLLKCLGIRVPTEKKYSILPIKIVGILPSSVGEGIILPADLTLLTGSDYDVDKLYVQRKKCQIEETLSENVSMSDVMSMAFNQMRNNRKGLNKEQLHAYMENFDSLYNDTVNKITNDLTAKYNENFKNLATQKNVSEELLTSFMSHPMDKKQLRNKGMTETQYDALLEYYLANKYRKVANSSKSDQINDQLFDMSYGIMTHPQTTHEQLTPGGFADIKHIAYQIANLRQGYKYDDDGYLYNTQDDWKAIQEADDNALKSQLDNGMDNSDFLDDIKFYEKNRAAKELVAITAATRISHAQLTLTKGLYLNVKKAVDLPDGYSIGGFEIEPKIKLGLEKCADGNRVSDVLAEMLAASLDNAKAPCLDYLNIDKQTIGMAVAMIRFGMPKATMYKIMSSNVVSQLREQFQVQSFKGNTSMNLLIKARIKKLEKVFSTADCKQYAKMPITEEDLLEAITDNQYSQGEDPITWVDDLGEGLYSVSKDKVDDLENDDYSRLRREYQILLALQKFNTLAGELMVADAATRFNSAKNAPGPTCMDNKIKLAQIRQNNESADEHCLENEDGSTASTNDVMKQCVVSEAFFQTLLMSEDINRHAPVNNPQFNQVMEIFSKMSYAMTHLKNDVALSKKLVNFYETWMYVMSRCEGNSLNIQNYYQQLKDSAEYLEQNFNDLVSKYKTQYKDSDNALLSILNLVSNENGKLSITKQFNTLHTRVECMSAWETICDNDPKFAEQLLNYCIYKGGICWHKDTWIQYLPTRMKRMLPGYFKALKAFNNNGAKIDSVIFNDAVFFDSFIRHNLNDQTFVPTYYAYGSEDDQTYQIDTNTNTVTFFANSAQNKRYFTTFMPYLRLGNKVYRFKQEMPGNNNRIYEEVSDLSEGGTTLNFADNNPPSEQFISKLHETTWVTKPKQSLTSKIREMGNTRKITYSSKSSTPDYAAETIAIQQAIDEYDSDSPDGFSDKRDMMDVLCNNRFSDDEDVKTRQLKSAIIAMQQATNPNADTSTQANNIENLKNSSLFQKRTIKKQLENLIGNEKINSEEVQKVVDEIQNNLDCFTKK